MDNPNHTISWPELTAILLARLSVLWLIVLLSLIIPHNDAAFHALMGVAFIITIPYSLWLRNKLRSTQLAPLQFLADLVLVTGLIYFTGGINSDLTLLYPLVILSASIVATPLQAVKITALGILIYVLMTAMLSQHMLVEYIPEGKEAGAQAMYSTIFLRVFTFALFGAASIFVSKRCSYFNQHDRDVRNTAQALLENLGAGIFLLDRQGQILVANPTACKLLRTTAEKLSSRTFPELCVSGSCPIPEHYGQSTYLQRTEVSPLPVSYRSADVALPATAIPGIEGNEETIEATLLIVSDLSHPLELERQLTQVGRITAATRIAGEMAHDIRTPLTTISASIQLLKHYEEKTTAADWLPNSPRKKDRVELFDHIMAASEEMDAVIQNFVDFAEFSPADLLSIIKLDYTVENQSYIGHLNTIAKGFEHGQNSDSGRRSDNSKLVE